MQLLLLRSQLPQVHNKNCNVLAWLDNQEPSSVIYISFGSRTAITKGQLKELGNGLVRSGCRFLWTVKSKKVDNEDRGNIDDLLGHDITEIMRRRGLVVKEWVDQSKILGHKSIGGFLSHCGWNSVMEAAWHGVPILAWPQHGDQKINADIVERAGVGVWDKSWGWEDSSVVPGEAIAEKILDVLKNNQMELRAQATRIKESVRRSTGADGRTSEGLSTLIDAWKQQNTYTSIMK